jgi:hypothetical protein
LNNGHFNAEQVEDAPIGPDTHEPPRIVSEKR